MKKSIFLIVLLALTTWATAQDYTFKRVFLSSGGLLKIAGEVSIVGDTIISINTNGVISPFKVNIETNTPEFKQFKSNQVNGDLEQRFKFNFPTQTVGLKKDEIGTLVYDAKDNFTGTMSSMTYYLIPK